jgi:hypothetical protein
MRPFFLIQVNTISLASGKYRPASYEINTTCSGNYNYIPSASGKHHSLLLQVNTIPLLLENTILPAYGKYSSSCLKKNLSKHYFRWIPSLPPQGSTIPLLGVNTTRLVRSKPSHYYDRQLRIIQRSIWSVRMRGKLFVMSAIITMQSTVTFFTWPLSFFVFRQAKTDFPDSRNNIAKSRVWDSDVSSTLTLHLIVRNSDSCINMSLAAELI